MAWHSLLLDEVAVQREADTAAIENKRNISCRLLTQLIAFPVWING